MRHMYTALANGGNAEPLIEIAAYILGEFSRLVQVRSALATPSAPGQAAWHGMARHGMAWHAPPAGGLRAHERRAGQLTAVRLRAGRAARRRGVTAHGQAACGVPEDQGGLALNLPSACSPPSLPSPLLPACLDWSGKRSQAASCCAPVCALICRESSSTRWPRSPCTARTPPSSSRSAIPSRYP